MVQVDWGDYEESIIVWRFGQSLMVDEYLDAVDLTNEMMEHRDYIADMIVDMRNVVILPNNVTRMVMTSFTRLHPNISTIAIITPSTFWKVIYHYVTSQHDDHIVHVVDTVDQAYSVVEEARVLGSLTFPLW